MPHAYLAASIVLGFVGVLPAGSAAAEAAAPPVSCATLTAHLSDDKNFYVLTATAAGDDSAITGYTFNFGDHESYRFTFNPSGHGDRHTATTTHAYQKPGTYTLTARADIQVHDKTSSVTSDTCKTSLSILPAGSALPNTGTGARNILGIGLLIAFLVAFVHNANLRRKSKSTIGRINRTHRPRPKRVTMRDA